MANLVNPVVTSAGFIIKSSTKQLSLSGQQIASGLRGANNIVDYVIGSKLRDNALLLRSVSKAAAYGINKLKTAESILIEVKEKLLNLKKIIVQANTAQGKSLERLNFLYEDGVKYILSSLGSAEFNGKKLFDGSFAGPGEVVEKEVMPEEAAPLAIRIGESISNTVFITLPKLLAGRGNVADQLVSGRFTPLFPITADLAAVVLKIDCNIVWSAMTALQAENRIEAAIFDAARAAGNIAAAKFDADVAAGLRDDHFLREYVMAATAVRGARAKARILSAGDLLDTKSQLLANNFIDTALLTVINQIATTGAQIRNLQQAVEDINGSIKIQNEAGDSYLNTDYEEATKKFKAALLAMQGGMSIISQGYLIAEAALELVTK